jgi:putative glutamine amidotransferase
MTQKPKILIPLAIIREPANSPVPLHFVRETYLNKLATHGMIPVFVSAVMPQEDIDRIYAEANGVLCTGGADINPSIYGATPHAKTDPGDIRRDNLELAIIRRAIADKKPFLGICRGAQMLNVATGGTLMQHLPDVYPTENHDDSDSYEGMLSPNNGHALVIKPGTKAAKIIGKTETRVSSGHHQAAEKIGKDLVVSATSPAGVIELLEHTDPNYFCFGLQSHPECCAPTEEKRGDLEGFFTELAKAAAQTL